MVWDISFTKHTPTHTHREEKYQNRLTKVSFLESLLENATNAFSVLLHHLCFILTLYYASLIVVEIYWNSKYTYFETFYKVQWIGFISVDLIHNVKHLLFGEHKLTRIQYHLQLSSIDSLLKCQKKAKIPEMIKSGICS